MKRLIQKLLFFSFLFFIFSLSFSFTSYGSNGSKKSITTYDDVNILKSSSPSNGSTVKTLGYYKSNDGGGATYLITNKVDEVNDITTFKLSNGLYATLQVSGSAINVDSLGAHGDGVSDDSSYIQAAFDSGYKVVFGRQKTYKLISNGIMINTPNIIVEGNGSHIIVDDSYSPSNPEFKKYILRGSYTPHNTFTFSNLNFDVNIAQNNKYTITDYLCVIHPLFFDNISLNNIAVNISKSQNVITAFWMYYGCNKLSLNKCNFANNSTAKEGGIFFLNSRTDDIFNKYSSFDNVTIKNTTFSGTCGDEALAIWGPNTVNAKLSRCTFKWVRAFSGNSSRLITVSSSEDSDCTYNVSFDYCTFECSDSANGTSCDSFLGIGSISPLTKINVLFKNCNINANVRDSLLHFQYYTRLAPQIESFDYKTDRYKLQFNDCDITCNKTLTGSNPSYDPASVSSNALDCAFNNCDIKCSYCVAYLQYNQSDSHYYAPKISMIDNTVQISKSLGMICQNSKSAIADITISNNTLTTEGVKEQIVCQDTSSNVSLPTQKNSPK